MAGKWMMSGCLFESLIITLPNLRKDLGLQPCEGYIHGGKVDDAWILVRKLNHILPNLRKGLIQPCEGYIHGGKVDDVWILVRKLNHNPA
jgi:hypothetical protein